MHSQAMFLRIFKKHKVATTAEDITMRGDSLSTQIDKFLAAGLGVSAAEWVQPLLWQQVQDAIREASKAKST